MKERKGERREKERREGSDCTGLRQAPEGRGRDCPRWLLGRAVQGALLPRLQKDGRSDFRGREVGQVPVT